MKRPEADAIDRLAAKLELPSPEPTVEYLHEFLRAFSHLVYENVSKIIRLARTGQPEEALRTPEILIPDHFEYGTGGTCFSLTYLAQRILSRHAIPADIVLGDRHYGEDTHCAVISRLAGRAWLLDVGFLIFEPVPLDPARVSRVTTAINQIEVVPSAPGQFDVHTLFRGSRKYRFTIKADPVEPDAFRPHWARTFALDMMNYPVVTRMTGGTQYYLQGCHWQVRTASETQKTDLDVAAIPQLVKERFGISPALTQEALELTLLEHGG